MKIAFVILGECCSMKNQKRLVLRGKHIIPIKSEKALAYEETTRKQIPDEARQMLTGPLRVTLHMYYSTERPDLDASLLLDLLAPEYKKIKGRLVNIGDGLYEHEATERVLVKPGVYGNDRQCREIHLYHHIDRVNPRAEVEIETMAAQQAALITDDIPALATVRREAASENRQPF